ncbi:MAG: PEP-CTERM sorting domain-containing protein [Planctomycetota bacterium]
MGDGSIGVVTVAGTDTNGNASTLIANADLGVSANEGGSSNGTLNINTGGLVTVEGTTTIGENGVVNLGGGRFEFGTISAEDLDRISGVSGSLAGSVGPTLTGVNDIADLDDVSLRTLGGSAFDRTLFPNLAVAVDTSEVNSGGNSGLLFGVGASLFGLTNNFNGEVEVITGERMIFAGAGSSNTGQITLAGGQVQFTQGFTNRSTGLVVGDGGLRADDGMINDGTMAFSATARVIGDVTNNTTGLITSSGGTTTFFDDVTNNGEIRTNAGSFTVYFGSYSGNGDTGTGTVIMEGDLKPGFSPGLTSFGGDLTFGNSASLLIELAGLIPGFEYDQITVVDDLILNGRLDVSLLGGFTPSLNQVYDILTVGGDRTGQFDGLGEGELVGNFGGTDLFITYAAGDGNDVALFSPIPEPTTLALLGLGGLIGLSRRR